LENYQPEQCIRRNGIMTRSRSLVCQWRSQTRVSAPNQTETHDSSFFTVSSPFSPLLSCIQIGSGDPALWCVVAATSGPGPSPPGVGGFLFPRLPLGAPALRAQRVDLRRLSCARHRQRRGQSPPPPERSVPKARHGRFPLVGRPHGAALTPLKEWVLRR
jgi:hypothetical protein